MATAIVYSVILFFFVVCRPASVVFVGASLAEYSTVYTNLTSDNLPSIYDLHTNVTVHDDEYYSNLEEASLEICAMRCHSEAANCLGFEYCVDGAKKRCRFYKKQFSDFAPETIISFDVCSFHSKNYKRDFVPRPGQIQYGGAYRTVALVSADTCAKLCVSGGSTACRSFDYCGEGNVSLCMLNLEDEKINPAINYKMFQNCTHYGYQRGAQEVHGRTMSDILHGTVALRHIRYSSGAVAAIGLGFLFVGIVLGFLAALGWSKWRGKAVHEVTEDNVTPNGGYQPGFRFVKFNNTPDTATGT